MNQLNLPEFRVLKVEENEQKDLKFTWSYRERWFLTSLFLFSTLKVIYPKNINKELKPLLKWKVEVYLSWKQWNNGFIINI